MYGGTDLALPAQVEFAVGAGGLDARAEELDGGDDPIAGTRVDDFEEGFDCGIGLGIDEERPGVSRAVLRQRLEAVSCFRDHQANAGPQGIVDDLLGRLRQDTLLDAGAQRAGQSALEGVAGVDDEAGVDVAPVGLEVGVHPREGARHRSASVGEEKRKAATASLYHKAGSERHARARGCGSVFRALPVAVGPAGGIQSTSYPEPRPQGGLG
jgi:hypothetical protein